MTDHIGDMVSKRGSSNTTGLLGTFSLIKKELNLI